MRYIPRIADEILKERLDNFGAVLIEGPRWCGKATTAKRYCKSVMSLHNSDMRVEYIATARTKPSLLLIGKNPRLIDQWQDMPFLWDAVRVEVDQRQIPGQFILTGSSSLNKELILNTANGRISRMQMLPLSLYESGESNGKISLKQLFEDKNLDIDGITSDLSFNDLIFAACRGGWPAALNLTSERSQLDVARNYIDTICRIDISHVDSVKRSPDRAQLVLKAYAENISTCISFTYMAKKVAAAGVSCTPPSFNNYASALNKMFFIYGQNAWIPELREATTIQHCSKHCVIDPSIAVAAMGLSPKKLQNRLHTFASIFEQLCIRDIKAYSTDFGTSLKHYKERYGLECDLVLHLADGRYALIQCRLSSMDLNEAANKMLKIRDLIREHNQYEEDTELKIREPDLMIILTSGEMAYTRHDGVKIIPIGCLKN